MKFEQAELRDAARHLLEGIGSRTTAGAAWKTMCDAGWPALCAPEALGGLGQSVSAACCLHLELGRVLSPAPLLPALLAVDALCACPPSATRDAHLERVIAGESLAIAMVDPAETEARIHADRVRGTIPGVHGAGKATHALIATTDAPLVAIVPLDHPDLRIVHHPTWDLSRELSEFELSDLTLSEPWVLARGAAARTVLDVLSIHLHFGIAADSVGAADALLLQAVAYLRARRQFDRPLAMFQALKHRCADLKTAVAAAEALLFDHLSDLEQGRGDPVTLARAAKSIASSTFRAVAEDSLQLHGGMGMTAEHPCHLFLKRALLNEQLASPDDACDLAVADELLRSLPA